MPPSVILGTPMFAPLPYRHRAVRSTVHALKFRGHRRAPQLLGAVLAPIVAEELSERRMFGTYEHVLVIPMPLHASRLRERGFNQAERIAHVLTGILDDASLVVVPKALVRTVHTPPQTQKMGRQERLMAMNPHVFEADPDLVTNRDVLLLDDVITTGATMRAARDTLLTAGARDVLCVAAAH